MALQFNPFTGTFDVTVKGDTGDTGTVSAAGDGTAAAPGISFTSDPNSGIYRVSEDVLGVSTGGVGRLFVDASGRVGIGTTSPDVRTRIVGTALTKSWSADANDFLAIESSSSTAVDIRSGSTAGGNIFFSDGDARARGRIEYSHLADELRFGTAGTYSRVVLDSFGRVGIGTLSPQKNLHINTNTAGGSGGVLRLTNYSARTAGNYTSIEFANNADYASSALTGAYIRSINTTNSVSNDSDLVFATGSGGGTGERLRILANGNVGIGATNPGQKLTVSDGFIQLESSGTTGSDLRLNFKPGFSGTYGNQYIAGINSELRIAASTVGGTNAVTTFYGSGGTEVARIDSTGRLGIGTTSPANGLLNVQGNANQITVNTSDLATYGRLDFGLFSNGAFIGTNPGTNASSDLLRFGTGGAERMRLDSSGRLLVGTSANTGGALLQVNGDRVRIATAKTPASATDTGSAGEICWDANYIYVCTATNTWKRTALATW